MKRNFCLLTFICFGLIQTVTAQISENFDARNGIALSQLKGYLQNHCWMLPEFDINRYGNDGNGSLMAALPTNTNHPAGIYTPALDVSQSITLSFTWQFNQAIEPGARRCLKIYLTDANNATVKQLDSIAFSPATTLTAHSYNKSFAGIQPGVYKVFLNYQATGGTARIAIDQLNTSASLHYTGGCNNSPVAMNDHVNGLPNHVASGQVTVNDQDADHDALNAYLVSNSPDGKVTLNTDGHFTFTPNPGFTGSSTTFTYRVCDNGSGKLCSQDATVKLSFPAEAMSLNDFKGLYNDGGKVLLSWETNFEQNSSRFEIERSIDGGKWQTAGMVKAQGSLTEKRSYGFTDEVSRSTAFKKDLYYRLKQIDSTGKVAMSRILVVRVYNTPAVKMVSVTPNPAKNDIAVTAQLNEASFVAMKILNADGAIVLNKALKVAAGANSFIMEGSSKLQPGNYMLDVTVNSKERMMVKLIKE